MPSAVCSVSERHTAQNLSGELQRVVSERQLTDNVISNTTDNAANITAAALWVHPQQFMGPAWSHRDVGIVYILTVININTNNVPSLRLVWAYQGWQPRNVSQQQSASWWRRISVNDQFDGAIQGQWLTKSSTDEVQPNSLPHAVRLKGHLPFCRVDFGVWSLEYVQDRPGSEVHNGLLRAAQSVHSAKFSKWRWQQQSERNVRPLKHTSFLTSLVCRYSSCHVILHKQGCEFNNQLLKDIYII